MDDVHRNDAPVWRIHVVVYAVGRNRMNIVNIFTKFDDAESLAGILIRAEVNFSVEVLKEVDGKWGYMFTVSEPDESCEGFE